MEIDFAIVQDFFFDNCDNDSDKHVTAISETLFPEIIKGETKPFWTTFMGRFIGELLTTESKLQLGLQILNLNVSKLTKKLLSEKSERRLLAKVLNEGATVDTTWFGLTFFSESLVPRLVELAATPPNDAVNKLLAEICEELGPDFSYVVVLPLLLTAASVDLNTILPAKHPRLQQEQVEELISFTLDLADSDGGLGIELLDVNNGCVTIVESLVAGGVAEVVGVCKEDKIVGFNDFPIQSSNGVVRAKQSSPPSSPVTLKICRCSSTKLARDNLIMSIFEGVLPYLEDDEASLVLKQLLVSIADSTIPLYWEATLQSFTHLISSCADGDIATLALDLLFELSTPMSSVNVKVLLISIFEKIAPLLHVGEVNEQVVPALCALFLTSDDTR